MQKPSIKPKSNKFSSGPCKKHPGWTLESLHKAVLERGSKSTNSVTKVCELIEKTKKVLNIPKGHELIVLPGSASAAITAGMWNFLGSRPLDALCWDVFGHRWYKDAINQLKIKETQKIEAPMGHMVDFSKVNSAHDVMFVWNGTSCGVSIPHMNWVSPNHEGLIIADATSAAFAMNLEWEKLDVTAFAWQKGLGAEAAHGMLVLSPKAIEHYKRYTPSWPIPFFLNLKTSLGVPNETLYEGHTINTLSMLCVEDCLQALNWAETLGGISALEKRSQANSNILQQWAKQTNWVIPVAKYPEHQSISTYCFNVQKNGKVVDFDWIKQYVALLAQEGVAFDIKGHALVGSGIRIWTGPTIEEQDLKALIPWLEWAYVEMNIST